MKATKNGHVNGHSRNRLFENDTLNELLGDLGPEQRVQVLGDMATFADAGKLTPEVATCLAEEARMRAKQSQPTPKPAPAPSQPEPPFIDRSNGETVAGDGRDQKTGRFTTGNQAARGRSLNPHARRQAALRSIVAEVIDETRFRKIVTALAEIAEKGDIDAAKFLFNYLLGRPGPAPDPDRLDLEEWLLANAQPTISEALRAFLDNVSAADATEFVQIHMEGGFKERVERREKSECARQIVAMRDKRSGRKRKPSAPLGG